MNSIDLEPYRAAIRERICAFCLDRKHDGECGRPKDDPCALESHLDYLVDTIIKVGHTPDIDDYVGALRLNLCPDCHQDSEGHCPVREIVHCALDSYVLPVVEVIEEVAEAEGHKPESTGTGA